MKKAILTFGLILSGFFLVQSAKGATNLYLPVHNGVEFYTTSTVGSKVFSLCPGSYAATGTPLFTSSCSPGPCEGNWVSLSNCVNQDCFYLEDYDNCNATSVAAAPAYSNFIYTSTSTWQMDVVPCSYYSENPTSGEPLYNEIDACTLDVLNPNFIWWNPTYNARCRWMSQTSECRPIETIYTSTDEPFIDTVYPTDCQVNNYTASGTQMYVNSQGTFYNLNSATGTETWYDELGIYFYDINNAESSSSILTNVQANSAETFDVTSTLAAGTYKYNYKAKGYYEDGSSAYFEFPSCCSVVSSEPGQATSTRICNWGTENYLNCANKYQQCIDDATGTVVEQWMGKASCGIQGVLWSAICPDPEALRKTKGILEDVKNRFPLTLFTSFKIGLSSFTTATSFATTTATTTFFRTDISGFAKFGKLTFFSDFRTILSYLFWILGGVAIVRFIFRNFLPQ